MLRNYWVKFWTNSIKHFWNNRPVRLPTLRFSYTLFLTVAILRFFKKGINFVITIAFCNDTAYTRVFWFDNWLVWRYSSWSAHENTWMLRTSFTASWKTNNHSSSCTLQTEHHFILPIYIMYFKQYNYRMYQTQEIDIYSTIWSSYRTPYAISNNPYPNSEIFSRVGIPSANTTG